MADNKSRHLGQLISHRVCEITSMNVSRAGMALTPGFTAILNSMSKYK